MSILISGMKLPKNMRFKAVVDLSAETAYVHTDEMEAGVFETYKAFPVPDHGDLIDRDALWQKMKDLHEKRAEEANMTGDRVVCVSWHDAVVLGKNAPVVIPAERSEE